MRKVVGLLAGLCLCAGCENELSDPAQSTISTGQFVVDYTAEAGVATRMIHENQAKGVRINSLTYLLYNSEGSLEKRREIPGLAGDEETWPLTRDNMTWEQREALKDTLFQDETYHVVFVANIDSAICGWTDETGALWSPLRKTEVFDSVHLQMPYQPFTDRNMFYLFTQDIHSSDQLADREKPYNCPVVLRRLVTRTDFLFEQLPVWEESTTEGGSEMPGEGTEEGLDADGTEVNPGEGGGEENPGEGGNEEDPGDEGANENPGSESTEVNASSIPFPASCTLPEPIKNYFLPDIYNMVLSTHREELSLPVRDTTEKLLDELYKFFDPGLPLINSNHWKYKEYRKRLSEIQTEIQGEEGQSDFIDKINQVESGDESNALSNLQIHLIHTMLNDLAGNAAIRELFELSANRKTGQFASIDYEGQSGVNTYYLSEKATTSSLEKSLRIEADLTEKREGVPYLGFQWVGLADPTMNKIAKLCWFQTAEAPTATEIFTPETFIRTEQGINEKYVVSYRPINQLDLKVRKENTKSTRIVCNLRTALPFVETDRAMVADIDSILCKGEIDGYKDKLNAMTLSINYPDVTSNEVLEITDAWKISKK